MQPKRPGWAIATVLCAATIVAGACRSNDAKPAEAPSEEKAEEPPDRVEVTADVAREAGIEVAPAARATLPVTVELTGEVAADPDRTAEVPVRVAGRIVAVRFKEGDHVDANQVLAVIESGEMARVKADLASTRARAKAARQAATRSAALVEQGIAPRREQEEAEADAASLEADAAGLQQTLASFGSGDGASARLQIRAPIAGYVMRRDAVLAQAVGADHTLAQITDLDHAFFLARLYEQDLARVRAGAAAEVRLRALPDATFAGTVESIGREVDPVARAVVARIRIDNHDDLLKIGLFGAASVATGDAPATPQVVVPAAAVTRVGERDLIFVESEPGTFEAREVKLGRASHDRVEIVDGLKEGERVAIAGVFALKSLLLKSSFGEDD